MTNDEQKPPYDADLYCSNCGATPVENTTICPNCSDETPHIIRHVRCKICGAPLMIRNKTGYENVTGADGAPHHEGLHAIISRTEGGTPKKYMCPTWADMKISKWREERSDEQE